MNIDKFFELHRQEIKEAKKDESDTALKALFYDFGMQCYEFGYEEASPAYVRLRQQNGRSK